MAEFGAWVSVKERLPDSAGNYIVAYHPCFGSYVYPETFVGMDNYLGKNTWAEMLEQCVTHWMPLPEAPKGE